MTQTDQDKTLIELLHLRDWLDHGNAYMEHPEGMEGTDRAVRAIDAAADAVRGLSAARGGAPAYWKIRDAMDALLQSCRDCPPKMAQCGEPCAYHARLYKAVTEAVEAGGAPAVPSEAIEHQHLRDAMKRIAIALGHTEPLVLMVTCKEGESPAQRIAAEVEALVVRAERGGSLAPAPSGPTDEIAWLVEGVASGRPVWWTGKWYPRFAPIVFGPLHSTFSHPTSRDDMEPIFSPEHLEAMRFARQEDAVRAIDLLPVFYRSCVKAIEHMWVARLAVPGEGETK